jgi:hypothetical protein
MLTTSLSNPSCMSDRRAFDSVLAVPSMASIEKDQVRLGWPIRPLVDTKQPFDRGSRPALLLRIELPHTELHRRLLRRRFV